ncbi:unnamed protein product [Rotaria sp. Silwood1]|nr:unnamed protein product [Rotaria sp. Silwood1]
MREINPPHVLLEPPIDFETTQNIEFILDSVYERSQILGNRVEMEIADAISQNNTLLRLNLQFDTLGPRVRVTEKLKQNLDALRKKRLNNKQ